MVTLDDIQSLPDDLDIDVAPPDEYPEQAGPAPLDDRTYEFVLDDFDLDRDRTTGKPKPNAAIVLKKMTVADGEKAGRSVSYIRVWPTVFEREGKRVSQLGDLIHSIDPEAQWSGLQEAIMILNRAKDQRLTFKASGYWEAQDYDSIKREGANFTSKSPEMKMLRKKYTLRGQRNFNAANNCSGHVWKAPSGKAIEARWTVNRFISKK